MRTRKLNRVARTSRVGKSAVGPPANRAILTIVDDGGGNALFTIAAAHGLSEGAPFTVSGASNALYNSGGFAADAVPTPTTIISAAAYQGDSTGGMLIPT